MPEKSPFVNLDKKVQSIEKTNQNYAVLFEIISKCIDVPIDKFDNAIHSSLAQIGTLVSAERAYLFKYDFINKVSVNTHEWCANGIDPQIHNLQKTPIDVFSEWYELHKNGETVIVDSVDELPPGWSKEFLIKQDIKSLILAPIFDNHNLLGFSGFDSVKNHHKYSVHEIEIIKIFGSIAISLTKRFSLEKNLKNTIQKLQKASEDIKTLSGLLPICMSCKKIRDDQGYWNQIDTYVQQHSEAQFSHGFCPECTDKLYGHEDWYVK